MPDASLQQISDLRLLDVHDGLHKLPANDAVAKAFELVTTEMARRGLVFKALNAIVPGKSPVTSGETKRGTRVVKPVAGEGGTDEEVEGAGDEDDLPPGNKKVAKRDYSTEERRAMAETGHAMPDGSFAIANEADLHHAIRLVGQASDPQAAMQHAIERAKSMGLDNALPENWTQAERDAAKPEPKPGANSMAGPEPAKPAKKSLAARIGEAVAKAMGAEFSSGVDLVPGELTLDPDFDYAVVKSYPDKRLTLGPVYMPDTIDAHGEWANAEDLENATIAYVKSNDRTVYLQHSDVPAGEWVSIMPWPQEVTAHMTVVEKGVRKAADTTFPAGTVYMGIEWQDWAWSDVKNGNISGLSMGGTARRREGAPA